MNLGTILLVALLVVLLVGFLNYGYLMLMVTGETTAKTGAQVLSSHSWMLYGGLALHVVTLGLAGGVFVKRNT